MENTELKKKILIADDDEMFLRLISNELTEIGLDVVSASNGDEAISKAIESKPNLILTDMIMPVKDGFQAIQELRSNPDFEKIKIIVFSSLGQEEDVNKAMALGANGYLVKKDYSLKDLAAKVFELLKD
jgi:two-component system alkaline phosphatase synthesis response regulator PhoP